MPWSKRDRMAAVLAGEVPDRPPVTAYRHFPGLEYEGEDLARALLGFQKQWDWDWLKLNTSAVCCYEPWENQYDYGRYEGNVPLRLSWSIPDAAHLERIVRLPGDTGALGRQLEAVRQIRTQAGPELPVFQTVFTPISVLLNLCGGRSPGRYRPAPRSGCLLVGLFRDHPVETHAALRNIAETLEDYARRSLQAGADGIFFAEMGFARGGYLTQEEWETFVAPYDRLVLEATDGAPAILHTCGIYGNPQRFVSDPVRAIHWAETAPGNPPIRGSESWLGSLAAMGGVDERLFGTGAPEQIRAMARRSLEENRHRPFLLAPECTVAMSATDDELRALREAAEEA